MSRNSVLGPDVQDILPRGWTGPEFLTDFSPPQLLTRLKIKSPERGGSIRRKKDDRTEYRWVTHGRSCLDVPQSLSIQIKGEQRALAARRYLVGLGIASDRLSTISYGEERPLDMGSTEHAWAMNRRAHFVVSE